MQDSRYFQLGGPDVNGNDMTSRLSYLALEAADKINIACNLTIRDSYFNMREKIEPCMYIVERAMKAMEAVGMTPKTVPIRGGTDGAQLSFMGLPCPNLFAGGVNFHSRYEFVSVQVMEKAMMTIVKIIEGAAKL